MPVGRSCCERPSVRPLAVRLPNADEIADHPQFGGVTVSFVYGCMRHDFNWRNLHRVNNHLGYDTTAGTWNGTVRSDADTRLGTDLYGLCNDNQPDAPETSSYHTEPLWDVPIDVKCGL